MSRQTPVQSKGIRWVAYDDLAKTLDVAFASSQVYRYFDVPQDAYEWLLRVESKGKFINRLVKDKYRYELLRQEGGTRADANLIDLLQQSLDKPSE